MIYLISYDKNYIHQILTKQKKCFGRRFSFRKLQGADFLPLLYDEFKADTKDPKTTSSFPMFFLFPILHSSYLIPHSALVVAHNLVNFTIFKTVYQQMQWGIFQVYFDCSMLTLGTMNVIKLNTDFTNLMLLSFYNVKT